ncbi:alpha/beta hydrolase [Xanthomonas albilineans]|uniref:Putative esterase/lipase/thioesterase transmembrane protein n=1 Tax=Xanthomonas albilineans (strain GPE PC73 / CFBP 7063) TaxID=380358 RepID=D2U8P2_XANAP|nr:alpha/beta hydrolase [Xanthomonas albilineans]QHQ28619.1 putative esterase/lipase/thioesterase transmembrane protein [Xanthomonas albilineans]CBA16390.1 putative esterase/lipase/thioesterase transmembrane protein [Xanthomonas albilineans GPE PC73]
MRDAFGRATARQQPRRLGKWRWLLSSVLLLLAIVALGPRVSVVLPQVVAPAVPQDPLVLQAWIDARERATPGLRPDNQARIVWADPAHPGRRGCAMVYLHGFTASQGEGAPTHVRLARSFGCNLYLPRLPGHGLVAADALRGVDAGGLLVGAAEALAVTRVLGERVVVIGNSMGGALAVQAVAANPRQVQALVLWSPLVRERDAQLQPMLWPWGAQVLVWMRNGGDPILRHPVENAYWADATHLDGYRALAALTRGGMQPATYARIHVPVFLGYYYRDAQRQDKAVSVAAMQAMFKQLGTPPALRQAVNFPTADDHVLASPIRSRAVSAVFVATCRFLVTRGGLVQAHGVPDCAHAWSQYIAQPSSVAR